METTKIPVDVTVAQIQTILGRHGACAVSTEYDKGEVTAVFFKIMFMDRDIPFKLPCRWKPIFDILYSRKKNQTHSDGPINNMQEQAKRIAWRQILRWVEAQMALVNTDMVQIHEVFLPYIQVSISGETLAERLMASNFTLLDHKK